MIAASPDPKVAYLWEPFSVLHRPGIFDAHFAYWFPYLCEENAAPYRRPVADMLAFRYKTGAELASLRSPRDAGRLVRDRSRFRRYRRQHARPLLKDPIAVFSSEWLSDTFDMEVVVLIRHPAAFANSVKRRSLRHPFDHFLAQPLLMRDLLGPFEGEIRLFAASEQPLLDQAILLWRIIHQVILDFRSRRPEWLFERLEDLAREPIPGFERLYTQLGQTFDEGARRTIAEHSDASNPEMVNDPSALKRDSRASIVSWKTRLSKEEIHRVRTAVEPISKEFYADADW